jgi:hypothetical protein
MAALPRVAVSACLPMYDGARRTDVSKERRRSWQWRTGIAACLAFGALASTSYGAGPPPTATLAPSFIGGQLGTGTSIHLGLTAPFTAAELPQEPWHLVVHLPLGTSLNFARLPRRALCNQDLLGEPAYGPKACPKASHVGPPGRGRGEHLVAGAPPTFANVPISPVVVGSQGGAAAIALFFDVPVPPFEQPWTVLVQSFKDPTRPGSQELVISPLGEVSSLAVTLGGNATIGGLSTPLVVMPKTCPKGGFRWRVDYSAGIQPERSTAATSPCLSGRATTAPRVSRPSLATTSRRATTAFQCEKRFRTSSGRARCFSQLPGASCAYPLEAQKTHPGYRGDTSAFNAALREEPFSGGAEVTLTVRTKPNIELCPYPDGVIYHVAEDYVKLPSGQEVPQEHNVRNIPLHFSPHGGTYTRTLTAAPVTTWYFIIHGRYVRPPWAGRA